jgi:hypothetical protein
MSGMWPAQNKLYYRALDILNREEQSDQEMTF